MIVLGISAFYHDSAAALVRDGVIVAAAQEERFTRKKHDRGFPGERDPLVPRRRRRGGERRRPRRLLRQAVPEVRAAARNLSRLRAARLHVVPHGHAGVAEREAVPEGPAAEGAARDRRRRSARRTSCCSPSITSATRRRAFYPSPFDEAAVLTMDGVGEWATTSAGIGRGSDLDDHQGDPLSRIRSACSTRRSPTTPASRSIPASTRSWGSRPTASRNTRRLILDHLIDLQARRLVPARSRLLRLLHRPDHDQRALRRAVRRPAAQAGRAADRSATWISPPRSRR